MYKRSEVEDFEFDGCNIEEIEYNLERLVKANMKLVESVSMLSDRLDDEIEANDRLRNLFVDLLQAEGYTIDVEPAVPAIEEKIFIRKLKAEKKVAKKVVKKPVAKKWKKKK